MTNANPVVDAYLHAFSALLKGFFGVIKEDDPEAYAGVSAALSKGATLRLETEFAAGGPLDVRLMLVDAVGVALEIGSLELERAERN